MLIIPAIDLRDGQCVRLIQGDYARQITFDNDPVSVARRWVEQGAPYLHLVDLDGAKQGSPQNLDVVQAIVESIPVPVEFGGGVRDASVVDRLLSLGVSRVIVGTRACEEPTWLEELCASFPDVIALGLDAKQGKVATRGWLQTTEVQAGELAREVDPLPLAAIIYTDISRDGMLSGPNVEAYMELCTQVQTPVIASGGVTTAADIRRLKPTGVTGCIVGRALYEEDGLTLSEAIRAAS